ncbi:hypothetical protein QBC42DRAFT_111796 [Cladorrhinum samala]|uniref:Uncharacterized protein n=1 Tax=Cladorrhinum samala TaxID=585594 RepID=A0AAV9HGH4_9PEZI|nr:hypothetical protein QBC42DRAFT_111796 [Cladorrhinum samala]
MSRALDKDTAAALKDGNPLAAFEAISGALGAANETILEIEILPKSYLLPAGQILLQDENAVGISKLGLVQAFTVARQRLRDHIDKARSWTEDDLFAATAVILLFDPEHLTAANTRKRLIQGQKQNPSDLRLRLAKEKQLLDSLLTSRLHRHTKSPTLWNHRRWLLGVFTSSGLPINAVADIRDIVGVAGERHPRNYYAWCHARFLISSGTDLNKQELLQVVQTWCFQHHTDISGWTFLGFLLNNSSIADAATINAMSAQVLDLVSSLRLVNESIWVFLRTLAASGLVNKEECFRFRNVQRQLCETSASQTDKAILQSAIGWYETYRDKN